MPKALGPYLLKSTGKTKGIPSEGALQSFLFSWLAEMGQQLSDIGCRDATRDSSALEHPLVSCQTREGMLSPRSIRLGACGYSHKPLRCLCVESEYGLDISRVVYQPMRQGSERSHSSAQGIAGHQH